MVEDYKLTLFSYKVNDIFINKKDHIILLIKILFCGLVFLSECFCSSSLGIAEMMKMDLLTEIIGDAKTNIETVKFLQSTRIKHLRSRPLFHEYYIECISELDKYLQTKEIAHLSELTADNIKPSNKKWRFSNTAIRGALEILLLKGLVFVVKRDGRQSICHRANFKNKEELIFECKNILTLNKMVVR